MYQLNNNYDLGQNETLINPTWQMAQPIIDNWIDKTVTVSVVLQTDSSLGHHRTVGVYDYNTEGTWEDQDLIDFILSLPDFEDSTLIPS